MSKNRYLNLLKKADNDLKIANSELSTTDPVLDQVCFHLQQFVEKSIKAYLVFKGVNPPRTHNLMYLLQEAVKIEPSFEKFISNNLNDLSDCAVEVRYEDLEYVDRNYINEIVVEISKLRVFIETLIIE